MSVSTLLRSAQNFGGESIRETHVVTVIMTVVRGVTVATVVVNVVVGMMTVSTIVDWRYSVQNALALYRYEDRVRIKLSETQALATPPIEAIARKNLTGFCMALVTAV